MPEPEEQRCQLGEAAGVVMRRKVGVAQQMSKDMQRGPAGSVRRDVGLQPPDRSSLGRYVFGSEISYNKPPPRLPGLAY